MITLYVAGEGFGLPEYSPYAMKTEIQLQLADLAYEKRPGRREDSPKGQIPWIVDGGRTIADTTFIRAYLEETYGVDLDAGLTPGQRAQAWAMERMAENQLGWVGAHFRFLKPDNFARGPAHWFDEAPEPMRESLRAGLVEAVGANVRAVGIGRHSDEEIAWLAERSLKAIVATLGDKPFLYGDRPVGSEAVVFSILATTLNPFFDCPVRRAAEGMPTLMAYIERMMARFYPEHMALAA
ncbi:MAG: glutathione S-transferase family protein [Caulobacteraceae bacterium]|nr:MAG: glutathione S-transferase family protein [Caulobacteraceae bacterium]